MQSYRQASTPRATDVGAPSSLVALVRAGVLDAELAALAWILVGARTPVVVAGEARSGREALAEGLADCLPPGAVVLPVAADDDFAWLPEARELGWTSEPRRDADAARTGMDAARVQADRTTGVLVVRDLGDPAAGGPVADRALVLVRALALGYGMLATAPGDGLEDLLARLQAADVGTTEDERSRLGVVLVMAPARMHPGPRVAAAHYMRPVALDTHGHVQRLPPAALATWNGSTDRWDHFAWGVMDDLSGRVGVAPRDLEREQARRAAMLGG